VRSVARSLIEGVAADPSSRRRIGSRLSATAIGEREDGRIEREVGDEGAPPRATFDPTPPVANRMCTFAATAAATWRTSPAPPAASVQSDRAGFGGPAPG
jgi:hypothetical protein